MKKKRKDSTSHLQGWHIVAEDADLSHAKYWESLFTLGNGYMGVRGSREEDQGGALAQPMTLIHEVYDRPPREKGEPRKYRKPIRMVAVPDAMGIVFNDGAGPLRPSKAKRLGETFRLDMRRGRLERTVRYKSRSGRITRIAVQRIVSQARPHLVAIRYSIHPENYGGQVSLTSSIDGNAAYPDGLVQLKEMDAGAEGQTLRYLGRTLQSRARIAVAARHELTCRRQGIGASMRINRGRNRVSLTYRFNVRAGKSYVLEKVIAIDTSCPVRGFRAADRKPPQADPLGRAIGRVKEAPRFDQLEAEHAAVWADYWKDCDIRIVGDRLVQTMARFFVFQLLQAASKNTVELGLSTSIPAKTLSGPGYNGRIFWDTEIYMLPFFSLQYPRIAESLLRYRYDRLEAARRNARAARCRGAKFPWESADSGLEECPKWLPRRGQYFRWRGGEQEIHVNADVPLGYWQHYLTTGNRDWLLREAPAILIETARYWASRVRKTDTASGRVYEIRKVIGPDEYHHSINNSVYTNAMARWNLQRALEILRRLRKLDPSRCREAFDRHALWVRELELWADVAERIKINFDSRTGLYEQFDGFFKLPSPKIKQADVLLLLYLLPDLAGPAIWRRNFDYYHPITVHGSSLSPGVHVLFALDAGCDAKAYQYELQACSIDGIRRDQDTDSGLHAASLGGGWTSIVSGFGGVRVMADGLRVWPKLPPKWRSLAFSIRYKGLRLRFRCDRRRLTVQADRQGHPVKLDLLGHRCRIAPGQSIKKKLVNSGHNPATC